MDARTNLILASLPQAELQELLPHLEVHHSGMKDMLHEPDKPIEHVFFPCNMVASLLSANLAGEGPEYVEVATVGREGFVGMPVFLGNTRTPLVAFTQVPGTAFRLRSDRLQDALRLERFHRGLHLYTQYLLYQIAQNAACNRGHTILQRAARWMKMTHDRVGGDLFPLTQEFLAQMLGVRRAGVSEAASALQAAGLIRYQRGIVQVTDARGLAEAACPCYRLILREQRRLLLGEPCE